MPRIVPIVEGDGELEAVPILVRKILSEMKRWDIGVGRVIKSLGRSNITKDNGIERFIHVALTEPDCCGILVLIDADSDCAKELAQQLARRVSFIHPRCPVVVVIANREYEAWFLASLSSIAGQGRLPVGLMYPGDVEERVGAKGWLSRHMTPPYRETSDQAAMTSRIDTNLAKARSRSFRRICHAIEEAVEAIDSKSIVVTPGVSVI